MKKGEEWREENSVGLLGCGREFITVGHDALAAHRERQTELRDPGCGPLRHRHLLEEATFAVYYNFLHGVELGLKSYLLHVEMATLEDLRTRFGHKLACLLDEALKHSLCSQCPKLTDTHLDTIRFLSTLYADKQFEYHWIGRLLNVPIDQVAETAKTLITELKKLPMKPPNSQDRRKAPVPNLR